MLRIRADLVDVMIAHARRDHPNETCGVIAGPEGTDRPERLIVMRNIAAEPEYPGWRYVWTDEESGEEREELRFGTKLFMLDSKDQLRLHRELEGNDEDAVVLYHSHTQTYSEVAPSAIDIEIAGLQDIAHHVIIGTMDPERDVVRSFRVADGVATEEEIEVVESYMFAHTGADDVPDRDQG